MSLCHQGAVAALLCGLAGAISFSVQLQMPRYVLTGDSATLRCDHSVDQLQLRKVEWFKGGAKLFQYVKGRTPPFRSYRTPGAELDWSDSDETRVVLRNLSLEATGLYSCEVSTETPIYTKPSDDQELTVVVPQRSDPAVSVRRGTYSTGDVLEANCTSSPARPVPHVAWFVDGKRVNESLVRMVPDQRNSVTAARDQHLSSATVQLTLPLARPGGGTLELLCVSTIPAFQQAASYVDNRFTTIAVEVAAPQKSAVRNTSAGQPAGSPCYPLVLVLAAWARQTSWELPQ
ncbi:uncharacterized protein LOC134532470 [Bacillus rossius redtenbacheri]|uniref:uncharacterized protein LOC134532470 n=1 Tax=Bacillus rossius redtenbacheri TaxID=93214 RepID=UPI002FDEF3AE